MLNILSFLENSMSKYLLSQDRKLETANEFWKKKIWKKASIKYHSPSFLKISRKSFFEKYIKYLEKNWSTSANNRNSRRIKQKLIYMVVYHPKKNGCSSIYSFWDIDWSRIFVLTLETNERKCSMKIKDSTCSLFKIAFCTCLQSM